MKEFPDFIQKAFNTCDDESFVAIMEGYLAPITDWQGRPLPNPEEMIFPKGVLTRLFNIAREQQLATQNPDIGNRTEVRELLKKAKKNINLG